MESPTLEKSQEIPDYKDSEHHSSPADVLPRRQVPVHILLQEREATGILLNYSHFKHLPQFKRLVPFSRLETPYSEVVLGLDAQGQYVVALAETETRGECGLALKFYGVPSPDHLKNRERKRCISPLLQTVRLRMPQQDDFQCTSTVTNVSLQIVASSDWKIGVAIIHHSKRRYGSRDDDCLGNLTLFEFPSSTRYEAIIPVLSSMICANVSIGSSDGFTIRNRLWKTNCIPIPRQECSRGIYLVTHASNQAGYLLFHDEGDGFRLSWIVDKRHARGDVSLVTDSAMPKLTSRLDIVSAVADSSWEHCCEKEEQSSIQVAMEAFLHLDILLDKIRSSRPEVFHYNELKCPDFFYRLVSVESDGRVAHIVVVFSNQVRRVNTAKRARRFPTSVGVFLKIDLFTRAYQEIDWGHCSHDLDSPSLISWASRLALSRRMKDQQLGPFSSGDAPKLADCTDWSPFLVEQNSEGEPWSPSTWSSYLKSVKCTIDKVIATPKISYSMLYPNADVLSNAAVQGGIPVSSLPCRSGTTEIVYS